MVLIIPIFLMLVSADGFGFVLLSSVDKGKLDATPQSPRVVFLLDPNPPALKQKDEFLGGIYQNYSDTELWPILVREAMERWNAVSGSYLEMDFDVGSGQVDPDDYIHTITTGDANYTASASAMPIIIDGVIVDCDVKIANRGAKARSLAYTLMHELGHCLGLGHNHVNYNAVMGYSRTNRSLFLGSDDKAGISYLYPQENSTEKELISCGHLSSKYQSSSTLNWLILLLPLVCVIINRRPSHRTRL